jgi:hypothetical protein
MRKQIQNNMLQQFMAILGHQLGLLFFVHGQRVKRPKVRTQETLVTILNQQD